MKKKKELTKTSMSRSRITSYLPEFSVLSEICQLAGFPNDSDDHVAPVIRETAIQMGLGRIIVLKLLDQDILTISNEWYKDDLAPVSEVLKKLEIKRLPSLSSFFDDRSILISEDINELPDDLTAFFESHQAGAVVVTRLVINEAFFGLVFFENCPDKRVWTESQTSLLLTVTGIIAKCIECFSCFTSIQSEKDKAVRSSDARGDFIRRISHEIRTPLNAIIGLSESLYYKVDSDSNRKLVKSMISSGKLLASLLNDILEISRIDAGKLQVVKEKTDTESLLDETEAIFHDIAARKNLDLIIEKSISLPGYIHIDGKRTRQILFNLVTNAISFTRWGYIKVSADYIAIEASEGRLILRIADTGPGISREKLAHIFDEYIQYENSKFYDEGSTGLGLALSKRLAEAMGGSIKAESAGLKGSVFTVVLPAGEIEGSASVGKQKPMDFSDIEFVNSSVLVIDDINSGLEKIENHTEDSGLRIYSANSLDKILESLKKNRIDLILIDHDVHIVSGDELVKMLRIEPDLQNIPVIGYTLASSTRDHLRDLDCYDDLLYKPVTRDNLFNLLIKYLRYEVRIRR